MRSRKPFPILIAEDDEDFYRLTQEALQKSRVLNPLIRVEDGEACMDYLLNQGDYADPEKFPHPGMVLLDLNMPRKNGHETLQEMKSHPELKHIPVIILTVSSLEEDILKSYHLGACSFIRKPLAFDRLLDAMAAFRHYWLEIVELPILERPGS